MRTDQSLEEMLDAAGRDLARLKAWAVTEAGEAVPSNVLWHGDRIAMTDGSSLMLSAPGTGRVWDAEAGAVEIVLDAPIVGLRSLPHSLHVITAEGECVLEGDSPENSASER